MISTAELDVVGRNPSSEEGEYFGANVWSWRPIQALIGALCSDMFTPEELEALHFNDGAGPEDQATCTEMANRFEIWMEHNIDGVSIDLGVRITPDGTLLDEGEAEECDDVISPHQTSDDHLKEWIEFLRHCGGFQVW